MSNALFKQVPLFAQLSADEIAILESSLERRTYSAQTLLFREGDYGDHFYVVLTGQIAIIKWLGTHDERVLGVFGTGEFLGEMSLLGADGCRTASAYVVADAQVLELNRTSFHALLQRHPLLVHQMLRILSTRLRESDEAAIQDLQEKNRQLAKAHAELQAAQAQIIEKEILERELLLAREIQESMLPATLPRPVGFTFGARVVPARAVGGDFFDIFPISPEHLGIAIGDVSGKGISAALFMALTCSLLRAEAAHISAPTEVVWRVNQHLLERNARSMFVTLVYGVLHQATHELVYVRAGHEVPLVWDTTGVVRPVPRGLGQPLGFLHDPALDLQTVILPPGSTLLLYTDGVTEAADDQAQFFGLERLHATVHRHLAETAQDLCDHVVQTVMDYQPPAAQADDITLVAIHAD